MFCPPSKAKDNTSTAADLRRPLGHDSHPSSIDSSLLRLSDNPHNHLLKMAAKETAQSIKVLDELMSKLTISKEADAIKGASNDLASFINGDIVSLDVPIK